MAWKHNYAFLQFILLAPFPSKVATFFDITINFYFQVIGWNLRRKTSLLAMHTTAIAE